MFNLLGQNYFLKRQMDGFRKEAPQRLEGISKLDQGKLYRNVMP